MARQVILMGALSFLGGVGALVASFWLEPVIRSEYCLRDTQVVTLIKL